MSEQLVRQNREFVEQVLSPYVAKGNKALQEEWQSETDSPSFELACLLAQRHFQDSLADGTPYIFAQVPHSIHFHEFEADWLQFVGRIHEILEKLSNESWIEDGGQFWDAMQYALEISPRLMQEFYELGKSCYEEFDRTNAVAVMGVVSLLNPLLFEPWLVQGMIHVEAHALEMALFCLTMAAIVRFDHPGPHLLMAKCYHELGQIDQALRCVQLGSDYVEVCHEESWRKLLNQIQDDLRRS